MAFRVAERGEAVPRSYGAGAVTGRLRLTVTSRRSGNLREGGGRGGGPGMAAAGRSSPAGPTGPTALRQRGGVPAAGVATRERRRPCVPAREHGDEGGYLGEPVACRSEGNGVPP